METELVNLLVQAPGIGAFLLFAYAVSIMLVKNYSKKRVVKFLIASGAMAAFWLILQLIVNFIG